jgi:hypothetical protein
MGKISIIMFLCHMRASSSNNIIGSLAPSSLFSSAMGGHQGRRGWSCKGSNSSSPNSLYPDLVGSMHKETDKDKIALIPLIRIYK